MRCELGWGRVWRASRRADGAPGKRAPNRQPGPCFRATGVQRRETRRRLGRTGGGGGGDREMRLLRTGGGPCLVSGPCRFRPRAEPRVVGGACSGMGWWCPAHRGGSPLGRHDKRVSLTACGPGWTGPTMRVMGSSALSRSCARDTSHSPVCSGIPVSVPAQGASLAIVSSGIRSSPGRPRGRGEGIALDALPSSADGGPATARVRARRWHMGYRFPG